MHNPFWVAGACAGARQFFIAGNHTGFLRVEEGRTRPSIVIPRTSHHSFPLTKPNSAKSASSQGEALALENDVQTPLKSQLKDMKMEFSS